MSPDSDMVREKAFEEKKGPRAEILTRRDFLGGTAGIFTVPWIGIAASQAKAAVDSNQRKRIEKALPSKALVSPRKKRKLLIFDLNVGYGGHGSIPTANLAFTMMGEKSGAFETVISKDPSGFKPENLKKFDAVFFNNTVGNLF